MSVSNGSYIVWIEFPKALDCDLLYQTRLERKISLFPGSLFTTTKQYDHCVRLSFARFKPNKSWQDGLAEFANLTASLLKT